MNARRTGGQAKAGTARKALFSAFAALVAAASILGVLSVAEYALSPYRGLPPDGWIGDERHTWGHLVENNAYGFRERDFASPKPPGVYRVMVLGDSLTWGVGLAVEERYTAVAEELLNRASEGARFEVLNFGLTGNPTVVERDILEAYKDLVEPDLVVVGFCSNDPQPGRMDHSIERENLRRSMTGRGVVRAEVFVRSLGFPYVSRLLRDGFYALAERAGLIPGWQAALQRAYEPSSAEWRDFLGALRDIRRVSDELGLPRPLFAVLTHGGAPTDYENPVGDVERRLAWDRQAEEAARGIGFATYNHEREIRNRIRDESLQVNPADEHPSANLNRVYGEKLYRKITDVLATRH